MLLSPHKQVGSKLVMCPHKQVGSKLVLCPHKQVGSKLVLCVFSHRTEKEYIRSKPTASTLMLTVLKLLDKFPRRSQNIFVFFIARKERLFK
jgi:hypothetical protein